MILLLDAALNVSAILVAGLVAARLLHRASAAMRHLVLVAIDVGFSASQSR